MLPVLETNRMLLRPLEKLDFQNMRKLEMDPDVVKFLGNGNIRTEKETREYLSKHLEDYKKYGLGLYAVIDKTKNQFIGRAGLIPWEIDQTTEWEVAYTLAKKYWGLGIATELAIFWKNWGFDNRGFEYLLSLIHPKNLKSIRVASRIGMSYWKDVTVNGHVCYAHRVFRPSK